jgi:hypothetical protein
MPTHEELAQFLREWAKLTPQQQTLFLAAVNEMVSDLRTHSTFRPSSRVKGVQGHPGVFEMTWWPPTDAPPFSMALRSRRARPTSSGGALAITAS